MQPKSPRDLLKVDSKERSSYGSFSLAHLTAYSVHWLILWEIPTTYENVSVLNARLFPQDFGMAGFPDLPDALRTNRSLLQMRPKYRGLATSDPRRGVYLTEKGRSEVARVMATIGEPTFNGKPVPITVAGIDPRRPNRDKERSFNPAQVIEDRRTRLLYRWYREQRLGETDVVHLLGLLGLYDHTPPIEVRRAFKALREAAVTVGDVDFQQFLDAVAERFRAYLERPDSSAKGATRGT
jgi:hypothetical protein